MQKNNSYLKQLIDVVALSRKQCVAPIQVNLCYAGTENFIGRVIEGYTPGVNDFALMTQDAGQALCAVQNELIKNHNMRLLIYDTYRPQRAVKDFVTWSKQPVNTTGNELARKAIHYPRIEKAQMFELGYVSANSQHCYGHTVDLVLTDTLGVELEHGACMDFMDRLSHLDVTADEIGEKAFLHRQILSGAMQKEGFLTYPFEYWHFCYKNKLIGEPMDFAITPELRGLNVDA